MKLSTVIADHPRYLVTQDYLQGEYIIVANRQDTDVLVAKLREGRFFHYRRVEGTRGKFTLIVRASDASKRILQWYLQEVSYMDIQGIHNGLR
jgi:hypothetical protein